MQTLTPIDRLSVTIIVDNVTDGLSTTPRFVEGEMAAHWRRRSRALSGPCLCCAAHGLSCLITAYRGGVSKTLLFDTGPDPDVFIRNVRLLGVDMTTVDSMVLSHGHWDHAGALPVALDLVRAGRDHRRVPINMHPDMFRRRAMKGPDGAMRHFADIPSVDELTSAGADVALTREPQIVLDGMFQISGEIPRVTGFERGMPGQHRQTLDGLGWEPDELLVDEQSVAVHVAGKGLIVFSACSHAGIINVLAHARAQFAETPIYCVMGGFHLSGANEEIIPETVEAMRSFDIKVVAAGHCTGWRAMTALANAYGDSVLAPLAVGKRFSF